MWVPERVWEQELVRDIADGGIEYTVLDDYHFKQAGLEEHQLFGHYLSEDDGRLIRKGGVMGVVLAGGEVRAGDAIGVELPPEPHSRLEKV